MKTVKLIKDGFANIMKGLGTTKDPRTQVLYAEGMKIDQTTANSLYIYNWLCAKVVDIPIDDATRKWITVLTPDPDKKLEIEEALTKFEVRGKINLAAKWARIFGGSVIIAIISGEDPAEPLDYNRIRPESLKNFIVLDRHNIYTDYINRNILSENFGKPEYYTVVRSGQKIHHTRLIKFDGIIPTIREYEQNNYWGVSIFTRLFEPISDSQITSQSISNLVYESNVDVYKIEGLNALVAEGRDDIVVNRLKIAHEMKSIINGIAIDANDDYQKKTNTFATLDNIDDRFIQKVAGAADIPITRLLGTSPQGMNATGESDMLNYYDNVQSIQENELRPKIDWLSKIIFSSMGYGDKIEYEFRPLKQLTELEKADIEQKNSQRDSTYLDQDIIRRSDVLSQLAENGTYVSIDENRVAEEKKMEELEPDFGEENIEGKKDIEGVEE